MSECAARLLKELDSKPLSPTDPLRKKFDNLPERFETSSELICQFLEEKAHEKKVRRWRIETPGALFKIAVDDLPDWLKRRKPPQRALPRGAIVANGRWMMPNEEAAR